ncbi:Creatinase/aminopeptidase [Aspergillus saccharolyticus JOP 1030-1]|uniref:Creatinase/aminopeptidase n=1 Tax=Aspergillus saccharolyticus JOP 1030-1 TaxID=1450539 RepID=A0A318ZL03_9EURO|nr:Creatinase/aminopeptidase [Aspergillus saccharolyticus JOP 1030-1]PYH47084.1 Creatinase/aminopeptidase [Aspergillus saccharolyticus JOP 1030-1]
MDPHKNDYHLLEEHPKPLHHRRWLRAVTAFLLCVIGIYSFSRDLFARATSHKIPPNATPLDEFEQCSIANFRETGYPFLDTAIPIAVEDFEDRRDRLARALMVSGVDAFVVEPGYTFKYYANISQPEWEVWEPEERPFLMVVQPKHLPSGDVTAKTSFLCPSFEAERARLLGMPFTEPIEIIPWEEHWDPYETLKIAKTFSDLRRTPRLMVDEEMRDFIQRGLGGAGFDVVGLQGEVERVRQIKSEKEIGILRAVNTGTVEAVRQMRKCLLPGLTESDIAHVLDKTLLSAGLEPFFDIVLFDENAANPHGGTNGSKLLDAGTFVLIDVGAHLMGYSSDICRTFFPPFLERPPSPAAAPDWMKEKLKVWDIVFEAQTKSIAQFTVNSTAASVDIAARSVISAAGYGEAFTHRVGHGIGIKAHESPYLNKGNHETVLRAGMTFTSEPGVYLVDKFGVRHEDIFLVRENDSAELLTGQRAIGPWDP